MNAGYGIAECRTNLMPSGNFLTETILQRKGVPDCEHRTKEGLEVIRIKNTMFHCRKQGVPADTRRKAKTFQINLL